MQAFNEIYKRTAASATTAEMNEIDILMEIVASNLQEQRMMKSSSSHMFRKTGLLTPNVDRDKLST